MDERCISVKFKQTSIFADPPLLSHLSSTFSQLSSLLPSTSSIELNFLIPHKDKNLFWVFQQKLKKIQLLIPKMDYFDSRQLKSQSFESSIPELKENQEINHSEIDKLELSQLISSITVDKDPSIEAEPLDDLFLPNKSPSFLSKPTFTEVFSIEMKEFLRFQAFIAMTQDSHNEDETFLPGIERTLPYRIEFIKGNKQSNNPSRIVAYGINKYSPNLQEHKSLLEDYIKKLVFEKISDQHRLEIKPCNINFFLMRIQAENKGIRVLKDFKGNQLIAAYMRRPLFVDICRKVAELQSFNIRVLRANMIMEQSSVENFKEFFKISFFADSREMDYRFRSLAKKLDVRDLKIEKIKSADEIQLIFKFVATPEKANIFRIEYESMFTKIKFRCIENIPAYIFKFAEGFLDRIRHKLEEEIEFMIKFYFSLPSRSRKVPSFRHIFFLANESIDEIKLDDIEMEIRLEISKYSQKLYMTPPETFPFLKSNITAFLQSLPSEYASFFFEEDLPNKQFYTYGPTNLHQNFLSKLETFINDRFLEFHSFNFEEPLFLLDILQEFQRKIFQLAINYDNFSLVNLSENLPIYINLEKQDLGKPLLFFSCFRRDKAQAFSYFTKHLKYLRTKLQTRTILVPKPIFSALLQRKRLENIEKTAQVEIRLFDPSSNDTSQLISRFSLKNKLLIGLFHGFPQQFRNDIYNAFPFCFLTGETLPPVFPRIIPSLFSEFKSTFDLDKEKGLRKPFYQIIERGQKKLKKLSIPNKRLFLFPVKNMWDKENLFDFFEGFDFLYGITEILKYITIKEKKTIEGLNVFLPSFGNGVLDPLKEVEKLLFELSQWEEFPVKSLRFYHCEIEVLFELRELLQRHEEGYEGLKGEKYILPKWCYLDRGLQGDWLDFLGLQGEFLEKAYQIYINNAKKQKFLFFEAGKEKALIIRILIKKERVFIEQFKRNMALMTFLNELDKDEWAGFIKEFDKFITCYKELGVEYLDIYACWNRLDGMNIAKLKNNTNICCFDLKESFYIIGNEKGMKIKRVLIKRKPLLKRAIKEEFIPSDRYLPLQQEQDSTSSQNQTALTKIPIYIKGFDKGLSLAERELEKMPHNGLEPPSFVYIPPSWEAFLSPLDYLLLYEIPKESFLFQNLKGIIEKTVKNPIYKIERMQNQATYECFFKERDMLSKKRGENNGLNSKSLFYGGEIDPLQLFTTRSESFDPKREKNGILSFFSEAKPAFERASRDFQDKKRVIYGEVLLGKSFEVKKGNKWDIEKKRPPEDGEDRFDSVTEKESDEGGALIRIFDQNRAFAEYLITFN